MSITNAAANATKGKEYDFVLKYKDVNKENADYQTNIMHGITDVFERIGDDKVLIKCSDEQLKLIDFTKFDNEKLERTTFSLVSVGNNGRIHLKCEYLVDKDIKKINIHNATVDDVLMYLVYFENKMAALGVIGKDNRKEGVLQSFINLSDHDYLLKIIRDIAMSDNVSESNKILKSMLINRVYSCKHEEKSDIIKYGQTFMVYRTSRIGEEKNTTDFLITPMDILEAARFALKLNNIEELNKIHIKVSDVWFTKTDFSKMTPELLDKFEFEPVFSKENDK